MLDFKPVKYFFVKFCLIISLLILWSYSFNLSLIKGKYYHNLSVNNRVVEKIIPAGRGKILDRNGRVIAQSWYQYFKIEGESKLPKERGEFNGELLESEDYTYEILREYPYGEALAFVSGYVSKVNVEDLKEEKCGKKLQLESIFGRGGVEESFDCELSGVDGKRLVEVDALGKYLRELGRHNPEEGKDVILSVDAYWQNKIFEFVKDKKAVVIMSNPSNGEVLAMVSSPAFNPNVFSFERNNEKIKDYLVDDVNFPLLNRAIATRYHPGSVFKIVMATAGLEEGVIDEETLIEDTGFIEVGDYTYRNWAWTKSGKTDGMINVVDALKRSNDIFFYKLGERLGPNNIKSWADKFGYSQKSGIDLAGEIDNVVPNPEWKKEVKNEVWFLGNTYHLSIGQGDLNVTPLSVNLMTNVLANDGVKCDLTLLKGEKAECKDLKISGKNLALVKKGLVEACNQGGTAWPLFNFETEIACKTGTAEVGDGSDDTHAWLTAYAPAENPEISITVFVERGGEGSDEAAPIVGDILKEWFGEEETVVPRRD
jgi:penicillin-binding protein 2